MFLLLKHFQKSRLCHLCGGKQRRTDDADTHKHEHAFVAFFPRFKRDFTVPTGMLSTPEISRIDRFS